LAKKLGVGFGIVIVSVIILGIVTLFQLKQIKNSITDIDERINNLNNAYIIKDSVKNVIANIIDMMLSEGIKEKEELKKGIEENRAKYREKVELIKKASKSDEEKKLLENIEEAIKDAANYNNKVIELAMLNKKDEAEKIYDEQSKSRNAKIFKTLDDEVVFQQKNLDKSVKEVISIITRQILISIILTVVIVIIGIVFSTFISRSVRKPVAELKGVLEKVAQGDLSVDIKVESKDELGMIAQSVHDAITAIKHLIAESKTISSSLASSS